MHILLIIDWSVIQGQSAWIQIDTAFVVCHDTCLWHCDLYIIGHRTTDMSWRTYVVVKQIQSNQHQGQDKMATILQMTISNSFSCTKTVVLWFKLHWNLCLRAPAKGIINNKPTLVQIMAWCLAIISANNSLVYWCILSVGLHAPTLNITVPGKR